MYNPKPEGFRKSRLDILLLSGRKSIVYSQGSALPLLPQRFSMTEWTAWLGVNWPSERYLAGSGR